MHLVKDITGGIFRVVVCLCLVFKLVWLCVRRRRNRRLIRVRLGLLEYEAIKSICGDNSDCWDDIISIALTWYLYSVSPN